MNIVPETNKPVLLNNETELHVQTVTEGSQSDKKSQMAQKVSSVGCKLLIREPIHAYEISLVFFFQIVQDLSTHGFLSNYVINLAESPLIARVLPKKIVESWIKTEIEKINESTVYIAGIGKV